MLARSSSFCEPWETEFHEKSTAAAANIDKIETKTKLLAMNLLKINSLDEEKVHQLQSDASLAAQETKVIMHELRRYILENKDNRVYRIQFDRLADNFAAALHDFQEYQKDAVSNERGRVENMSALVKDKQSTTGLQGPPGVRGDTGDPPKLQTQTLISLEEDAEKLAVLEERQNNVKVLEREIRDVNEIFRDLATLIHEQGTVVDSIEANIETGDLNLSSGLDELERARRKASQRRHRKFIIYGIISAIALLFLITLFSAIFA